MTSLGRACALLLCVVLGQSAGTILTGEDAMFVMRDSPLRKNAASKGEMDISERYVGDCETKVIYMTPGNKRDVWSYGYIYLNELYKSDCYMRHSYNTKVASDPFCKFGFHVTGTFESHGLPYTTCYDTDYLQFNDTNGNSQVYCGAYSDISYTTSDDEFELVFSTTANSPGGKGWYITILSFKLCGGALSTSDGPTGSLTTPLIAGVYPNNMACTWYFQTGTRYAVKIGCDSFSLEDPTTFPNGTSYCLDFTSFTHEAISPSQTTTYCSNAMDNYNHVVYSSSSSMIVQFRSDESTGDTGFVCSYELILYGQ